jgi:hypothetical protein
MKFVPGENVDFLTALGRFVVRFAAAETGLDICNVLIFQFCEGRTVEPEIPRSLERKIMFFTNCQERCKNLATSDAGFRELAKQICREFTDIRNDRHFLVHGMAVQILKNEEISLSKLRLSKVDITEEKKTMPLDSIIELGDRAWELSKSTIAYNIFLLRFVPTDKLDKALTEADINLLAGFPSA